MVTFSNSEYSQMRAKMENARAKRNGITPESICTENRENLCVSKWYIQKSQIIVHMRPFPAVRSNKNSWSDSVKKYHNLMNELRNKIWNDIELVKEWLKSGDCELLFIFAIPESYSKKKAQETQGKPFLQKPDIDNLIKSLQDTVFYKSDDSWVYRLLAEKRYALIWETSKIIIKKSKINLQ